MDCVITVLVSFSFHASGLRLLLQKLPSISISKLPYGVNILLMTSRAIVVISGVLRRCDMHQEECNPVLDLHVLR